MDGMQMVLQVLFILQDGMESLSFMTECIGFLQRLSIQQQFFSVLRGNRNMQMSTQRLLSIWTGKPDLYHAIQATLIPYYAPELSIAVAVKEGKIHGKI